MTDWTDRSTFGTVLRGARLCCTWPGIVFYVIIFFLILDPIHRVRNSPNDFQPAGNGHLTDSMSPLIRNALSWSPVNVIGLQLGLLFANSLAWCLHTVWVYKVAPTFSVVAGILELLLGASGVLPGLMGIYTFNWWGCRALFYGQDPQNITENGRGRAACDVYRGATYLYTIMGFLWIIAFILNMALGIYGAGRRVVKRDDIELNRPYQSSNNQQSAPPVDPPAYSWAPSAGFGTRKY